MPDQKLGSLYYTVGIQGMQSFLKDTNALRKQIVDIANTPVKSLLAAIDIPDVAQMQRTLNANRTNTINALRTALGSGTLNRSQTAVATRALDFIKADSAATIGLFQALQQQRRAFSEKIGGSAEELKSIQTMIKAGEASGEITKGSGFANNLRATAAHATIVKSSMEGVNDAILRGDAALARSYDTYQRSGKSAADFERLAAATAKHKVNESLAVEKAAHKESERITAAKKNNAAYGEFEFEKMASEQAASTPSQLLVDARRRTRQYVNEQLHPTTPGVLPNIHVETDPAVLRARKQNAIDAEATDRSNRLDALLIGSRDRLAGAERTYEAGPKTRAAQDTLNQEALRYGIEERRARERVAAERRLEEHAVEAGMPRDHASNAIRNQVANLDEIQLHGASKRLDIESRINSMLGTQVSQLEKVAEEERIALEYARQRLGRDLTPAEERGIREDTRNQSMRTMLGADASGTSSRLTTIQKELDDLNSARPGATTDLAAQMDKRIRNLREEASILVRREQLLRRQAELEGFLANGGGTWNERRLARRELGQVQTGLVQNEIVGENARRHAAGQRSRNANYRMQELSYGVQDFAQVLSGGGGLDAALRAANNNISQFYAAAGGPNAARYSLIATASILSIAAAMKYISDQTDLPIKKLEEFTERLKHLQQVRSQAAKISEGGITGYGETAGGNLASISSSMGGLGLGIRNRRELLGNQVDIFGGRQREGFMSGAANVGKYALAGLGGMFGLESTKKEFLSKIAGSNLGTAFYERFSEGKSAREMTSLSATTPPEMKRFFDAITKSRGTTAAEAVRVFKEIDQGGGWADAKNQEEVDKLRKTVQELDDDLTRLRTAAHAFDLAVAEMARNLDRRNASLGVNTSGQAQFAARSDDVKFINEARAQIRQKEGLAKYWEDQGRTDVAKSLREENDRQENAIKSRLDRMAPGRSGFFTEQAASFESMTAPLGESIRGADEFRRNATTLAEQIEAARQQQMARDNADKAVSNFVSGHRFNGQRANESFMEADQELSDSYLQMIQSIDKTLDLRTNAGRRAKEGLDRAKKQEDELRASARLYERDVREAKAFGTSFDEQRAAIEESRNKQLAKAEKDYFDDPIALKRERDIINRGSNRELEQNLKQQERARLAANNMFAGDAAGLMGGRAGQHYSNAASLETKLNAIKDLEDNLGFSDDAKENARIASEKRQQAQSLFEEQKKQIEHKQVGFSDIGGMWKQIQMSLKPDKSIEMQRIANDHLDAIRKLAEGAGLKMQISLGA